MTKLKKTIFFLLSSLCFITASFAQKKVKKALNLFLKDSAIVNANTGVFLLDADHRKTILNHQGSHFFLPASNTKIASLYAGIKYLGDSLPALLYHETADTLYVIPTADPSFLTHDFNFQPTDLLFIKNKKPVVVLFSKDGPEPFGKGWTMDDRNAYYAPERNIFPVYGNVMSINSIRKEGAFITQKSEAVPDDYQIKYHLRDEIKSPEAYKEEKNRQICIPYLPSDSIIKTTLPFETDGVSATCKILEKKYGTPFSFRENNVKLSLNWDTLQSQPSDSFYRIMMHRSDNMYAEHLLLMAGYQKWSTMDDGKIREHILVEDLKDLPQEPKWMDGSGLSRYNLFTPESLVSILLKLNSIAGLPRLKNIFPTGGNGTLKNNYLTKQGLIFAKTGSLRNNTCLSGFMETKKKKTIYFSIMVNNHTASGKRVREAIEKLLLRVIEVK